MRFVIAGTGRSGTKWCATVLRMGGVPCGHEQVFLPKLMGEWAYEWGPFYGDASFAAVPRLEAVHDALRVLVVRHPLDVADSFRRVGSILAGSLPPDLDTYLRAHHSDIFEQPSELAAGVAYWVAWNTKAKPHVERTARIEDLTIEGLFDLVAAPPQWPTYHLDPINTGPQTARPDWSEIPSDLAAVARELATSFGYE